MENVSREQTINAYQVFKVKNNNFVKYSNRRFQPDKEIGFLNSIESIKKDPSTDYYPVITVSEHYGEITTSDHVLKSSHAKIKAVAPIHGSKKGINMIELFGLVLLLFGSQALLTLTPLPYSLVMLLPIFFTLIIGIIYFNFFNSFERTSRKIEKIAKENNLVFYKDPRYLQLKYF